MPIAEPAREHLLLDTHVWLWTVEGARSKLTHRCLSAVRRANREGRIWVSAMSVWEIAVLEAKGWITLSRDRQEWVDAELAAPGMNFAGLTPEIAIDSTRLPGGFHRDPADRILIATARHLGARLVTRDARIIKYAKLGHLRVLDARA